MSSGTSFETKEQVKRAINIVDLVGDYLQLRREGRGYKALCPWHNDSNPSLQVNPDRQSFKCWVCDVGGDVFSFVMKIEGVSFPEALALLAERAGITLVKTSGKPGLDPGDKRLLYQAMAWAEEQYHRCLLAAPEAAAARDYLAGRGLSADSLRRFHLGYAPSSWDWIATQARGTRFTPQILETIGLVARRRGGEGFYDRFRGRVLFSIRDAQGRPVGVGGRVLPGADDAQGAKYINSPETPLFSKSHLLYGLDFAKDAMAKSRTAVVMEGYTDCLIAQQHAVGNAVAALGTAFGERHLRLLRRYAERIVLVLDGDEAGRRRTDQLLEMFVAEPVDLRVLTLPDNLDPCDYLLAHGAEAFAGLLADAVDALEHKFRTATAGLTAASGVHQANQALEEVLATLAKAPRLQQAGAGATSRLKEDQILNRLAARFGVAEERIRARLTALRRIGPAAPRNAEPDPAAEVAALDPWERELLEVVLLSPGSVAHVREEISAEELTSPLARRILAECYERAGSDTSLFDRLLVEFDEPEVKSLLVDLDERGRAKGGGDLPARVADVVAGFRRRRHREEHREHAAALAEGRVDESTELQILRQIIERERNRQGISAPTDG